MKQTIVRKDGITYERNLKQKRYGEQIYVRISSNDILRLHLIADKKKMKYSDLIRTMVKEYIKKESKQDERTRNI